MRKQILAILIALGMTCAFAPMVGAGDTDSIAVTLTPGAAADILVNKSTWNGGGVGIGGEASTSATWANLTNEGYVSVSVAISVSNPATWTIQTAPGHNQFSMNTTGVAKVLSTTPQTFINPLHPPGDGTPQYAQFGLLVRMPTSSSTNSSQVVTVTFTGTVL